MAPCGKPGADHGFADALAVNVCRIKEILSPGPRRHPACEGIRPRSWGRRCRRRTAAQAKGRNLGAVQAKAAGSHGVTKCRPWNRARRARVRGATVFSGVRAQGFGDQRGERRGVGGRDAAADKFRRSMRRPLRSLGTSGIGRPMPQARTPPFARSLTRPGRRRRGAASRRTGGFGWRPGRRRRPAGPRSDSARAKACARSTMARRKPPHGRASPSRVSARAADFAASKLASGRRKAMASRRWAISASFVNDQPAGRATKGFVGAHRHQMGAFGQRVGPEAAGDDAALVGCVEQDLLRRPDRRSCAPRPPGGERG